MVNEIGSWASILGVILTALGFLATFRRLRQLRPELVGKVRLLELRSKVDEARGSASELLIQGNGGAWKSAGTTCGMLKSLLIEIRASRHLVSPDIRNLLSAFVGFDDDLELTIKSLEYGRFPRKTRERIRFISGCLDELAARLDSHHLEAYL